MPALVLAVLTLLRLELVARVPLAPDEAYYWIWSRALAPGYFDHPPMVALWIRAGTWIAGDTTLGVRLLGPLSVALGSWLLADAAERLLPGRNAGVTAAALSNATLLLGVGSIIITPDTPLLFFWTATLWALARVMTAPPARTGRRPSFWRGLRWSALPGRTGPLGEVPPTACSGSATKDAETATLSMYRAGPPAVQTVRRSDLWWLVAGGCAGLALASKYTAALLGPGAILWLLWAPSMRGWLRRAAPWIGAVAGGVLFLPVIWWNSQHHWAGFLRQGGRIGDWQPARAIGFLGELLGGQIGLATPLIFVLCAAGLWLIWRRAWRERDPASSLLTALSLPGVLVFLQHAIGGHVLGNWPAIVYPAAWIAAAALTPAWLRFRTAAVSVGLAITGLVYLLALVPSIPLPRQLDPMTRQLGGWRDLAIQVEAARHQSGATFVVAEDYALAAELAWTLPVDTTVVADDPRWRLFTLPHATVDRAPGLAIRLARDGTPSGWQSVDPIGFLTRSDTYQYRLFRVQGRKPDSEAAILPRPDRDWPAVAQVR
jgi:4-amino-4-deoxy-L-arabinose transferase-like glycosyltransferase